MTLIHMCICILVCIIVHMIRDIIYALVFCVNAVLDILRRRYVACKNAYIAQLTISALTIDKSMC